MNLRGGVWKLVLAGMATIVTAGCPQVTQLQQENQQLRVTIMELNDQCEALQAQAEALESEIQSLRAGGRPEPEELARLRLERDAALRKVALYEQKVRELEGRVRLSEKVQAQLQQLAKEMGGVLVGNRLLIPGDYFFASGKYELMPDGKKALARFTEFMAPEGYTLLIVGHTDNDPIKHAAKRGIKDNRHLSVMRSWSVLNELKKNGYPPDKMYPSGWGALHPVRPNTSTRNKQMNRRVEIFIDPAASGLMNVSAVMDIEGPMDEPVEVIEEGGPVIIEE